MPALIITPILLLFLLIILITLVIFVSIKKENPSSLIAVLLITISIIAIVRTFQILADIQILAIYGGLVTLNYLITFYSAGIKYEDPATKIKEAMQNFENSGRKPYLVHYVIPVFNESGFITRCIESILVATEFIETISLAKVEIVVVNDASTDDTWEKLQVFAQNPHIKLLNLKRNGGKKNALACGMYGGENWRDAFSLFDKKYLRKPKKGDKEKIIECLNQVGCNPTNVDIFLHTDSDSEISKEFIYYQVVSFSTHPNLGALSGHCDVWLDPNETPSFITKMQVAWYSTQFRIRKAAESSYGAVFCVSGPGAGFRANAVWHLLPSWVDDNFGGRIYRGATDRKLTLLILIDGWNVLYSEIAKVWTVVPDNLQSARSQWVRWKQNSWRMLIPVWMHAWREHPIIAFLTYSRTIISISAPFILGYHLIIILLGDFDKALIYLFGITMMGTLMGIGYVTFYARNVKYAYLRPFMSLLSAFWGSVLTLDALFLTLQKSFTWRETNTAKAKKGKYLYRWFVPNFELRFMELILFIVIVILFIRYFYLV